MSKAIPNAQSSCPISPTQTLVPKGGTDSVESLTHLCSQQLHFENLAGIGTIEIIIVNSSPNGLTTYGNNDTNTDVKMQLSVHNPHV